MAGSSSYPQAAPSQACCLWWGLVPEAAPLGDALGALPIAGPSQEQVASQVNAPVAASGSGAEGEAVAESKPIPAKGVESAPSSDDESSSASDHTAAGEDFLGVMAEESAAEQLIWFRQGKKVHIAAEEGEDFRRVPWCRDVPFVQDPSERGVGFFTMISPDQLCQRCRARMPRGVYLSLAEYCGWPL